MSYIQIPRSNIFVRRDEYAPVFEVIKQGNREKLSPLPIRAMITDEEPGDFEVTQLCIHPDDIRAASALLDRFPLTSLAIKDQADVDSAGFPVLGFNGIAAGTSDFYLVFGETTKVALTPFSLLVGNSKGRGKADYEFGKALAFEMRKLGIGQIFHENEANVPPVD